MENLPQLAPACVTVNPLIPDFAGWLFLPFLMTATLGLGLSKRLKKQQPTFKRKK
jgi:hypothetical protein